MKIKHSPMYILVVNAGSSSIKYSLFKKEEELIHIFFDKHSQIYEATFGKKVTNEKCSLTEYEQSPKLVLSLLMRLKLISSEKDIVKLGFRIVHGGKIFTKPTKLTDSVLKQLEKVSDLAPLHNPPALSLIHQWKKVLPNAAYWGVFDTAFHTTIPEVHRIYAIPKQFRDKGIEKYGFHGISCASLMRQLKILSKGKTPKRVIICHLGSGCSITAVKNGKSLHTTMGLTPLDGIVMGSRPGHLDPGAVLEMIDCLPEMKKEKLLTELQKILYQESGLIALAGTKDMKKIVQQSSSVIPVKTGIHNMSKLALELFVTEIAQTIGSYYLLLGGVDTIIFSGGIGVHSAPIRKLITKELSPFGININQTINKTARTNSKIQTANCKTQLIVLDPKEEQEILLEISELEK